MSWPVLVGRSALSVSPCARVDPDGARAAAAVVDRVRVLAAAPNRTCAGGDSAGHEVVPLGPGQREPPRAGHGRGSRQPAAAPHPSRSAPSTRGSAAGRRHRGRSPPALWPNRRAYRGLGNSRSGISLPSSRQPRRWQSRSAPRLSSHAISPRKRGQPCAVATGRRRGRARPTPRRARRDRCSRPAAAPGERAPAPLTRPARPRQRPRPR